MQAQMAPPKPAVPLRALLAVLALGLASCGRTPERASPERVDDLPRLLVVYSYATVHRTEVASWFDGRSDNPVHRSLARLETAFEKLGDDLATRVAFTKDAYVLPVGAAVEVPGRVPNSTAFVVPMGPDRALVVLSGAAPRRTAVVTVDNRLEARLLYDSFALARDTRGEQLVLGALARIEVLSTSCLRLRHVRELDAPPQSVDLVVGSEGVRFGPCAGQ